jgi:hypothetical protein
MSTLPGVILFWLMLSIYRGREFTITAIISYVVFILISSYFVYKQSITPIIETNEEGIPESHSSGNHLVQPMTLCFS